MVWGFKSLQAFTHTGVKIWDDSVDRHCQTNSPGHGVCVFFIYLHICTQLHVQCTYILNCKLSYCSIYLIKLTIQSYFNFVSCLLVLSKNWVKTCANMSIYQLKNLISFTQTSLCQFSAWHFDCFLFQLSSRKEYHPQRPQVKQYPFVDELM